MKVTMGVPDLKHAPLFLEAEAAALREGASASQAHARAWDAVRPLVRDEMREGQSIKRRLQRSAKAARKRSRAARKRNR